MEQEKKKMPVNKTVIIGVIVAVVALILVLVLVIVNGKKKSGSKNGGNNANPGVPATTENQEPEEQEPEEGVLEITVEDCSLMEAKSGIVDVTVTVDDVKLSADEVTLTYRIEDETIAKVDEEGNITGLMPGKTVLHITATTADGKSETKDVEVVITEDDSVRASVSIGEAKLAKGEETKIAVKYHEGVDADGSETGNAPVITYTSDNKKVATVDKNGNVKAVGSGTATITVTIVYTEPTGVQLEETYSFTVEVHEHDYAKEETKAATCTEEGVNTFTCKVCKDTYTEAIAKNKHKYEEAVTKEATCTVAGEKTYTCELCGDSYTESISKKKHNYAVTASTPATCTQDGTETYTCKDCGDSYTGTGAAATGHSYTKTGHTDSTCQVAGSDVYTCTCGDSYTDTLALAAHTLGGWTTDKVVSGERVTNYKRDEHFKLCSVCNAEVDRHSHSALAGGEYCPTCGVQMPVY